MAKDLSSFFDNYIVTIIFIVLILLFIRYLYNFDTEDKEVDNKITDIKEWTNEQKETFYNLLKKTIGKEENMFGYNETKEQDEKILRCIVEKFSSMHPYKDATTEYINSSRNEAEGYVITNECINKIAIDDFRLSNKVKLNKSMVFMASSSFEDKKNMRSKWTEEEQTSFRNYYITKLNDFDHVEDCAILSEDKKVKIIDILGVRISNVFSYDNWFLYVNKNIDVHSKTDIDRSSMFIITMFIKDLVTNKDLESKNPRKCILGIYNILTNNK